MEQHLFALKGFLLILLLAKSIFPLGLYLLQKAAPERLQPITSLLMSQRHQVPISVPPETNRFF